MHRVWGIRHVSNDTILYMVELLAEPYFWKIIRNQGSGHTIDLASTGCC